MTPGQEYISASQMNRLMEEVKRLTTITALPPLEVVQEAITSLRYVNPVILAKLTDEIGSWVEVNPDGNGGWIEGGRSGNIAANPAYEANGLPPVPEKIVHLFPGHNDEYVYWLEASTTSVSEESFLAMLTAKCYIDGSPDPDTGTPTTCQGADCLGKFTQYAWTLMKDHPVDDSDGACPVTYTLPDSLLDTDTAPEPQAGVDYGGFTCFPIYQESNLDIPTFAPPSPIVRAPATTSDDTSSGTSMWAGTNNMIPPGSATHILRTLDYCFSIPGNVQVTKIKLRIVATASTAGVVKDTLVKLIVGGAIVGNDKATNTPIGTGDTILTYDYSPINWGVSSATPPPFFGPLQANDGFGAALQFTNSDGSNTQSLMLKSIKLMLTLDQGQIQPHSVVRARKGAGDYYLADYEPWIEFVRRTSSVTSSGTVGFIHYFDPNVKVWKDSEQVLVITADGT